MISERINKRRRITCASDCLVSYCESYQLRFSTRRGWTLMAHRLLWSALIISRDARLSHRQRHKPQMASSSKRSVTRRGGRARGHGEDSGLRDLENLHIGERRSYSRRISEASLRAGSCPAGVVADPVTAEAALAAWRAYGGSDVIPSNTRAGHYEGATFRPKRAGRFSSAENSQVGTGAKDP